MICISSPCWDYLDFGGAETTFDLQLRKFASPTLMRQFELGPRIQSVVFGGVWATSVNIELVSGLKVLLGREISTVRWSADYGLWTVWRSVVGPWLVKPSSRVWAKHGRFPVFCLAAHTCVCNLGSDSPLLFWRGQRN